MAKLNIADIRQEYTKGGLRESELPGAPLSIHLTTGRRMENQSPCSFDFIDFSWQLQLEYVILQL